MDPRAWMAMGVMLVSAAWGVATTIRIQDFLWSRGRIVSFVLLRLMVFDYVRDYRRITRVEIGRVGPLYTHFVAAWLIALASAMAALAVVTLA